VVAFWPILCALSSAYKITAGVQCVSAKIIFEQAVNVSPRPAAVIDNIATFTF
jgi:hypothetical protein